MTEDTPMQLVSSDALGALERSQIDMQITTAKKYPRSIKRFLDEAEAMISLNAETAEACNYKLKRKGRDGVKVIEGPSIRLLEIAASAYGNLRYGSRIIGIDDEFVTAQGIAFDLEKNVAQTVETKRAIRTKDGQRFGTDMIMVTSNAAGSVARRNALNGLIPRAYIAALSEVAKKVAVGDMKSVTERLQRAFDYYTKTLGVDLEKVLAYLEKPSIKDCGIPELESLQGLKTLIKEGEITLEAAFDNIDTTPSVTTPDLGAKASVKSPPPAPPAPPAPAPEPAPEPPAPSPATARKKKEPKPEPAPEPAAAGVSAEDMKTPAPAPAPVEETAEERVLRLAETLQSNGVSIDDFFDWVKASGRAQIYKIDIDSLNGLSEFPDQFVSDLLADKVMLGSCIKMFGKKS